MTRDERAGRAVTEVWGSDGRVRVRLLGARCEVRGVLGSRSGALEQLVQAHRSLEDVERCTTMHVDDYLYEYSTGTCTFLNRTDMITPRGSIGGNSSVERRLLDTSIHLCPSVVVCLSLKSRDIACMRGGL
jgi:hypothetical protein